MSLSYLSFNNFWNIEVLIFELVNGINIIYGENGSGKISFFEVIYFFFYGKLFCIVKYKNIIQY